MKLFCVNFGSTSTKIGAFDGDEQIFTKSYDVGKDGYPAKFANLDEHQAFAIDLFAGVLAEACVAAGVESGLVKGMTQDSHWSYPESRRA